MIATFFLTTFLSQDAQPAAGDIFRKVKLKSIWSGKKVSLLMFVSKVLFSIITFRHIVEPEVLDPKVDRKERDI